MARPCRTYDDCLRDQARQLRTQGFSYRSIGEQLNVVTATVGHWCRTGPGYVPRQKGRDPEKTRERKRRFYRRNRTQLLAAQRAYRAANRARTRAQATIAKALERGTIQREPCLFCGAEPAQAHHHDYSQPYAVTWLCRHHHALAHGQVGRGVRA